MPFAITLTSIMLLSPCPAIAPASPPPPTPAPPWQTELTPHDLQAIEQLAASVGLTAVEVLEIVQTATEFDQEYAP